MTRNTAVLRRRAILGHAQPMGGRLNRGVNAGIGPEAGAAITLQFGLCYVWKTALKPEAL